MVNKSSKSNPCYIDSDPTVIIDIYIVFLSIFVLICKCSVYVSIYGYTSDMPFGVSLFLLRGQFI